MPPLNFESANLYRWKNTPLWRIWKFTSEQWIWGSLYMKEMVSTWKNFDRETVGKQLIRSADSVAANIAEGYGRFYFGDKKLYGYYARGSLLETMTWLEKAHQRNLLNADHYYLISKDLKDFHLMLNIYIKKFKDNPKK